MAVEGDACGIESASRTYGAHASTAHAQAQNFGGALTALPSTSFAGGKADASRVFAGQLQSAAGRAAQAYDRVASFLPRVATAVRHSQHSEQALNRARADLVSAVAAVATATAALAAAEAVVATKSAAGVVASIIGVHVGPSAAELAAVGAAKQRLTRAEHHEQEAQRAERTASNHFQDAERARHSVLNAFTALCQDEAAALGGTIPTPPPTTGGFLAAIGNPLFIVQNNQTSVLRAEARTLADMPEILRLIEQHNPTGDLKGVQAALITMQYRQLDAVIPVPPAPKRKPEHHSLISLHTLGSVAGAAGHTGVRVLAGAKDGLVGTATGIYGLGKTAVLANNIFDPTASMQYREQLNESANRFYSSAWHHPLRAAGDLVGAHDLVHDPGHWAGNVGFSALAAVATDGASAELKATQSADTALRAARDLHVDRALRGTSPKHLARAIDAQRKIVDLGPELKRLERADAGLHAYGKAGSAIGVPGYLLDQEKAAGACKPYGGDGVLAGRAAGQAAKHAPVHLP